MTKEEFKNFVLTLAKELGVHTLDYVENHFDELKLPGRLAPVVKFVVGQLKAELSKKDGLFDGLVDGLHQFDVK